MVIKVRGGAAAAAAGADDGKPKKLEDNPKWGANVEIYVE